MPETQIDVENFFISAYYMITGCMGSYWNGLYAKRGIPWFYWSEFQMPRPGAKNYVNWGFDPVLNQTQPINLPWSQQFICGASMLNESTATGAWGWSNKNCSNKYISICKISRGWRCCCVAVLRLPDEPASTMPAWHALGP